MSGSALSFVIDPITRDLKDSADGWFEESDDSRTMVLWQLESTYNAWWGDPSSGSRIAEIIRGDVGNDQDLFDEVLRALQPLVVEGVITDLVGKLELDEAGRVVVLLNYRDRGTGNPVDLAYVPFGG